MKFEDFLSIPILYNYHIFVGSKLPWTMKFDNASVFTLKPNTTSIEVCNILETCCLSATLAATTKYHPPRSDNISSLALCIHSHINLVIAKISDVQVDLLMVLLNNYQSAITSVLHSVDVQKSCYTSPPKMPITERLGSDNNQMETGFIHHQQGNAASPQCHSTLFANSSSGHWDITEPVPTLSETSDSSSQLMGGIDDLDETSIKLSMWMQCTVARCSMALIVQRKVFNQIKLCVELEDLTSSIDLQEVFSKVKVKLGSLQIHHYVIDR